jgi:hypothetical protein
MSIADHLKVERMHHDTHPHEAGPRPPAQAAGEPRLRGDSMNNFDSQSYNDVLKEASEWFEQECRKEESITVSAHVDRGDNAVYVQYHTIRDRKHIQETVFIPVYFFATYLSKDCRLNVYCDLLNGWRKSPHEPERGCEERE